MFKKSLLLAVFLGVGVGAAPSVHAEGAGQIQVPAQFQGQVQKALDKFNSMTPEQKKQFLQQHQGQIEKAAKATGIQPSGQQKGTSAQIPAKPGQAQIVPGAVHSVTAPRDPQQPQQPAAAAPGTVALPTDFGAIDPNNIAGLADNMTKLQTLLANPWVQRYLKLYQDPKFLAALDKLMKSENRMNLLYAEIGLMVFIFLLRTWRSTKVSGFMGAIWLRMWTFAVFATFSAIVLPAYLLGDSYAECVNMIFKAFTTKV